MSDNTDATQDVTEESTTNSQSAVNSSYKVLGEFTNTSGAGVLGQNNASGGTPIGVQGAVPKNTDGYGLYTKNDARIEGKIDTNETDFVVDAGTTSTEDAQNVVMGHESNSVEAGATGVVIAGGGEDDGGRDFSNTAYDDYGTIGGGVDNEVGTNDSNEVNASYATVSGGNDNEASANYAAVAGGNSCRARRDRTFVGAGRANNARAEAAAVCAGQENDADGKFSFVGGGNKNCTGEQGTTKGSYATVGGGANNQAIAEKATVSGGGWTDSNNRSGTANRVYDNYGTIGGGGNNQAGKANTSGTTNAVYATVAGGRGNTADGAYSFAAGRKADASGNNGAFVWGDSSTTAVTAGATDQVRFQASGGFVVENTTQFQITDGLPGGSGTPVEIDSNGLLVESANVSSVRYKTDIEPLEPTPGAVLELEPRSFVYEETGDEDVGFLAEEADECVPELVGYDEEGRPDSIHYDRIGVFLLPEVRRNRERIEELEEQVSGESVAEEGTEASQSELDRKDDRIADLEAELSQKDERIDELAERLAEKDERMADLEDRLAAVETQVGSPQPADD